MGAAKVLRYRETEVPRQVGEVGRLRVLKGPNEGMVFVLTSSSIVIGRGEDCDLIIGDFGLMMAYPFTCSFWHSF